MKKIKNETTARHGSRAYCIRIILNIAAAPPRTGRCCARNGCEACCGDVAMTNRTVVGSGFGIQWSECACSWGDMWSTESMRKMRRPRGAHRSRSCGHLASSVCGRCGTAWSSIAKASSTSR
jgi:hypothetical protein